MIGKPPRQLFWLVSGQLFNGAGRGQMFLRTLCNHPKTGKKSYFEEEGEGNKEIDLMKRKSCYQETGAPCILLYDDLMMMLVMMYIIISH